MKVVQIVKHLKGHSHQAGNTTVLFLASLLIVLFSSTALSADSAGSSIAVPAVGSHSIKALSPTLVELSLVTTKDPAPSPVTTWNFVGENFTPNLPAASSLLVEADSTPVAVAQVGFKRRPIYAPLKKRDLRIGNYLYLTLASPLAEGQEVTVKNPAGDIWNDATMAFRAVVDPYRLNPALHVNQTGYVPGQSKKAMAGYYLGSLGEMPITATTFNILDAATKTVVFTGPLQPRLDVGYNYSPKPYQQVKEADFTAFQTPGEYVLHVPGMGISYPFFINEGTGAAFARTYALGLYHQRCGCANAYPFTRHTHEACHVAPAEVPDMTFTSVNNQLAGMSSDYHYNPLHTAPQLKDVNSSLYPFVNNGVVDVSGGHHDAGDYSKYTINSASLIHHLVFAADTFPGASALDNLNIPESGDGKSDLLQQAKWEADFLAKMQDADGGFYFLVYPRNRAYEDNVLPDHGDSQVVFPKTTAVTAAAVGALAEIASSPTFKAQFPVEAANYLAKATQGWAFLMAAIAQHGKNGSYQKITHYGNEFMHDDELAWAAAAMFVATGNPIYQDQLKAWYDPSDRNTRRWTWWRLFEGYGNAARAYAFAAHSGRLPAILLDGEYLSKCQAEIVAAGDDIARFAAQTAYGASFPDPNKSFQNAGWFFSSERAFELTGAAILNAARKPVYMEALMSNLGYEAGCNPINVSYVTGLGWQRWHDIVHQYAQNDERALPPSGIPLGNIQMGFAYLENYKQELGQLCFPPDGATVAPYPFYDRWGDSFNTTTEFVVVDLARAIGAATFLMTQTATATQPSTIVEGQIQGIPAVAPAEQMITATFTAPGLNVSEARVVWEATGQDPFIGSAFTFAAKAPGAQWVEVEAQWPDGTRVFARTQFTASFSLNLPPNEFQSAALAASGDMAALYHFDGDTVDATGKNLNITFSGNARFDEMNLGWMASRSGKALRFDDLGDAATVNIPSNLLYQHGNNTEIALEAMVYVNAYKGYNRGAARLLSLQKAWNASLEWMEDTYTGAHIRGGTQFDFYGAALNAALPLKQWKHLSIRINANSYSVYVDGALAAQVASTELGGWANGTAQLQLGNFDGWIDELVIYSRDASAVAAAPASPGQFSGTAMSPSQNHLTWTDLSDNETGFRIYRSLDNVVFDECGATSANATSWTDNNLAPATSYFYSLTAFNALGESSDITTSITTLPLPPAAPTGLVAIGERAAIQLGWSSAPTAVSYQVKRSSTPDGPFLVIATGLTGLNYTDASVVDGVVYHYVVTAINAGGESPNSNVVTAGLIQPPMAPTGLTAMGQSPGIHLAWTSAPRAASYTIKRALTATGPFTTIATGVASSNYIDDTVNRGVTYRYVVTAVNGAGESPNSTVVSAMCPFAPGAPSLLSAVGSATGIKATWTAVSGAKSYTVKRSTTLGGTFETIVTGVILRNFVDVSAVGGITYYYSVTAENAGGSSPNSNVLSAERPTAPVAPANLTLDTVTSNKASIRWMDNSANENGFYVERAQDGKPFVLIGTLAKDVTTFQDATVKPRLTYHYRVRAFNSIGYSPYSNTLTVRTP